MGAMTFSCTGKRQFSLCLMKNRVVGRYGGNEIRSTHAIDADEWPAALPDCFICRKSPRCPRIGGWLVH
jgi:hypothetical protein